MNNQCVFCSTSENLTVTMQVTVSSGPQTVYICTEHEDQASPKKVRELAEKRNSMLQDFQKQAEALGFKLVPMAGGVIAAESPAEPQPVPVSSTPTAVKQENIQNKKPIAKKVRDIDTPSVAADNKGNNVDIGKHSSYDTTKPVTRKDGTNVDAPGIIDHEEQVVTGRGGAAVVIPKKIVSEAGVTEINIVDTGGDKALQNRFKATTQAAAEARSAGEAQKAILQGGYMAKECPLCKGVGITKINNQTCKKCNGVGTT